MIESDEYMIVLRVVEGIGLNYKCENVLVTASLGGNSLETEVMPAGVNIQFNSNLIWETEKGCIKRMKTENLPIKVECFTVTIVNGQECRILIGHLLIPLRGIPITTPNKSIQTKPHWHKLIGLNSESRAQKPELLLLVTITDKSSLDTNSGVLKIQNTKIIEDSGSIQFAPDETVDMLTSQSGLYIKLLQEDGLLQVGNIETDCDIFIARLMFKHAKNLEHVVSLQDGVENLFRFQYSLLGSPTDCPLVRKGNELYSIQEKIAIHFRTSLKSLREYFDRVLYIPIELYLDETLVGRTRFSFRDLLKIENLREFIVLYGSCDNTMEVDGSFTIETRSELPSDTSKPCVEYNFSIKYLSRTNAYNHSINSARSYSTLHPDQKGGGDTCGQYLTELPPTGDIPKRPFGLKSISARSEFTRSVHEKQPFATRSDPVIPTKMASTNFDTFVVGKSELRPPRNLQRTFSLNLILQTVKFTRRPDVGIWQISFHHPKSETTYTIANVELTEIHSNMIEFGDLKLQLFFSSTADDILDLIVSEPCVLTINGPRGFHATADLDNEMLLVGTKEKRSGLLLMEDRTGEKIAMANIFVNLDDLGLSFNSQTKRISGIAAQQPRPYMDENLAYKIVEELEEWKLKQMETFLFELKQKEMNHLARLTTEWQKTKCEQERILAEKLDECSRLTAALDQAYKNLGEKEARTGESKCDNRNQIKAELERTYSEKLVELEEKAQNIEVNMAHKLKLEQLKYRELEIGNNIIVEENGRLKSAMNELEAKIDDMQRSLLSPNQLTGVFEELKTLRERFEQVEKSKNFYKDQWAKIIREVHKIKLENVERKMKRNRPFGLKDILTSEHDQLESERLELNFIKDALFSNGDDESEGDTMR